MMMNKTEKLAILLATYQGERFLEEQLSSLFGQTYEDWQLYIHDDGSTDKTPEIIEAYAKNYPDKVILVEGPSMGGAKENFLYLMKQVEAPYYMCCDQDDVWLPEKVEKTFSLMKQIEASHQDEVPCLVFTELKVVDGNLKVIAESMSEYQKLDCKNLKLSRMLMQNAVTGCTMMINKALRDKVILYTDSNRIIMHDWWASLIAAQFGEIAYLKEATILYRQHGENSVGALDSNNVSYILKKVRQFKNNKKAVENTHLQAKELVEAFDLPITSVPGKLASCIGVSKAKRLKIYKQNDFKKSGLARNLGLIIWG
jgi:glycosyltransferase involved in cell wall biosynthesis